MIWIWNILILWTKKNLINIVNWESKISGSPTSRDYLIDVITRLEFAGIDKDKIVLVENLNNLIKDVKENSVGDIYTMVCFDMTANILRMLEEDENEKN